VTNWSELRLGYDAMAAAYRELLPDLRAEQPVDRALLGAFCAMVTVSAAARTRSPTAATAAPAPPAPPRVLDAGCGTGRLLPTLLGAGFDVVGADLSAGMLQVARREHPDLTLHEADLRALPLAGGSVDGVLAWYSLIHCDAGELAEALVELTRVLRPGGVLLTGFQSGDGPVRRGNPHDGGHERVVHLRRAAEMGDAAARAGLTVLATCTRAPEPDSFDAGEEQAFVIARRDDVPTTARALGRT
jgi:SAM-dependent methyltransferase